MHRLDTSGNDREHNPAAKTTTRLLRMTADLSPYLLARSKV